MAGPTNTCPQCGTSLSDSTLDGMCPGCAAGIVMGLAVGAGDDQFAGAGASAPGGAPAQFGEFELIEEIDRGGMGVVYRARQKRLNRTVALKMILAGRFAGEEQVRRFRAEAAAAAGLRHPNILAIHDVGEVDGQDYFCMDLIEGPNLAGLVRERPLPAGEAAQLVMEIAGAVQFAHEQGVIHRDLKPSNIIIDRDRRPLVTDFGLARRLDADSDLTHSGQVLGSPNFVAPEQAAGGSREAGPLSDVYSLGAILYYLLVGRPPFLAESLERTLSMVLGSDAIPPRRLDPGVPRDLETICLKCLEKEPARRYASAGLIADELGRFLRGEPIQARPISPGERLVRWTRRNRTTASLAALAACLLIAGVAGVLSQWRRAERSAASELAQRSLSEQALTQLRWQQAEEQMTVGLPDRALANLATLLRGTPTNQAVAERIVSVLSQRRFPMPTTARVKQGGPVTATCFGSDGRTVVTGSADGTALVWDAISGSPVTGPLTHDGPVNSVEFSPDGLSIVTGSEDGSVRLWNAITGEPIWSNPVATNGVLGAEFDPQGGRVIVADREKNVWVLVAGTGASAFPPIRHESAVTSARFGPDGSEFLTASRTDALVRVFDAATGREVHRFTFNGWIESARFSPDGKRIVVANYHRWASIWTPGGDPEFVTVYHGDTVNDAVISPDGLLLATASRDGRALVWDSRTGELVFSLPPHLTWVDEVSFEKDGLVLMTREKGNRVILWDLLRSRPLVEPLQSRATLTAAELAPAGRHVILASMDGTSQVWGVAPADFRPLMLERDGPSLAVDFHPNGRQLVVGSRNGMVTLWNVERALAEKSIRQQGAIYSIRFSPDGSRVLGAAHDGTAQVWNVDAGGQFAVRHAQRVIYAEFSPDGRTFVTASFDGTARTWSAEDGAAVSELMRHSGRLWHASFGPDGSWVATAGDDTLRGTDHHARVWDAQTGRAVTLPLRHTQQVYHVAFDPKGTSLASASADNTVAIWTIPAGVRTLTVRHRGPVRHVAFNPTSRYIVSSSQDNTAQIWDLETGLPVGEAMHHPREVLFAEWRPDGRRVVTACGDGAVRMWDPTTGRPTSEPLQHHGMVGHPRFSPDGRRLACPAPQVCIWELPTIDGIPPVWLPDLAESVAGTRLNGRNTKKETFPGGLFELGQELMAAADSEPMIPWARWIFEERFKIDPGNRVARHAGSEGGAEQLSRESVIAAIHIDPADASHWFQLSRMTRSARPQDNPQRDAQAEYFHRKAAMLAPESLDEWLERLEWLQTSGDIDRLARNFSDALSLHPANIELRWRHAQWLEQSGRQLEALDGYHRVVALETNRTTIRFFRSAQRRKALRSQFGNAAAAQSEWQNTVNVASRSDDLPRSSVDLAAHYNAALHEPWHDRKRAGNDFSQLVPGRFEVGGTVFDIRGIIQLGGIYLDSVEPGYPGAVRGIAIDRPCEALHFLHGAGWGSTEPEGTAVGRYVVHYADGIEETIPLHVGTDLLEWFQQGPQPLADLAGAKTIDMGRNGAGIPVRLFLRSWRNPRPTVPIASVDFESAGTGVAPFLVALTTEP